MSSAISNHTTFEFCNDSLNSLWEDSMGSPLTISLVTASLITWQQQAVSNILNLAPHETLTIQYPKLKQAFWLLSMMFVNTIVRDVTQK